MQILYTKPILKDLSQGSRIVFVRQFRMLNQDDVADKLGVTGERKRRTMTRYEKGQRVPKEKRLNEIASILSVNKNLIKKYDYKNPLDIAYIFLWMEEIIPNFLIDLSKVPRVNNNFINAVEAAFISDKEIENINTAI